MTTYLESLKESPIIAVVRKLNNDNIYHVIEALLKAGIRNIEITYGSNSPTEFIENAKREFKDEIMVGAGTVLTLEQAKESIGAGAEFIFSPIYNEAVVSEVVRQDIISIPGCYSPTEIYKAHQAGAQLIKVFPATSLGPNFIKDIKAPMPFLNIIPTGGIDKSNILNFIKSGAIAVGMGSSLLDKKLIADKNYAELTRHAQALIHLARQE